MTLPIAPLLELLDSLAAQASVFQSSVGDSDADTGSIAEGAANNIATVRYEVDGGTSIATLIDVLQRRQAEITSARLTRALQGERLQVALDSHYGGAGGLNRFLEANGARVHPDLGRLGIQIDAQHRFAPAVVTFGAMVLSGPGAGVYTAAAAIDGAASFGANTVVRATTAIGGANIVATLTLTRWDVLTETRQVTIPAATAAGMVIDVGTHGTDMYVACTAVSVTGGTAADAFQVRTEVERHVAL